MRLYDAHNHLQDARLAAIRVEALERARAMGVRRMVVNGCGEDDWERVRTLAARSPLVIPSFGYHPWYVHQRTSAWQERLVAHLNALPSAIGEIGLDRWILSKPARERANPLPQAASLDEQAEVFTWQLRLAAQRRLPVSIHCLQAWGRLHEILRAEPLPDGGFLLHSYGGPPEMIRPLADLGAYFSLPGYFAHERKQHQRETFRHVPLDRLLIETDAPDQCPPQEHNRFPLTDIHTGTPLHHPANLLAVYEFAAQFLNQPLAHLAERVEANFHRLFGKLVGTDPQR